MIQSLTALLIVLYDRGYFGGWVSMNHTEEYQQIRRQLHQGGKKNNFYCIFHRVMSRRLYHWNKELKKPILHDVIASQYDIATLLHDHLLYDDYTTLTAKDFQRLVNLQVQQGLQLARNLILFNKSGVMQTIFYKDAMTLRDKYVDFTPLHCPLRQQ